MAQRRLVPFLVATLGAAMLVVLPGMTAQAATANVALGATATQSSTAWGGPAQRAADGNTDGVYGDASVSHTDSQAQAWWALDLRSSYTLTNVVVWNRTDCCSDRLSNFYVLASDSPIASTDLNTARNQAGVSSYYVAGTPGPSVTIALNRTSRYLRVQLAGTGYLTLAEVQAFASNAALRDFAEAGTATQSSTAYGGVATRAIDGETDGTFGGNSVTHTDSQAQPWWALDLRGGKNLTDVVVWNRTDCCTSRLSDFYLLASDNPITSTDLTSARNQPGVSSYHVASITSASVTIPIDRSARYLRVQLAGTGYLSIAEVQAFGSEALLKADADRWVAGNNFGMFMHFGLGTMTNAQWADPATSPSVFNPGSVDTTQWAAAIKSAGMTFGALTAKHHDGFALWPTSQNSYSVASSPWKGGGGDLVREYVSSMRAAGLKVGLYFSIWDRHNGETTELVKNELRELLTSYGPIDYLWFDGWGWHTSYDAIPYRSVRDFISNVSPATVVANNDHRKSLDTTDVVVYEVAVDGFPSSTPDPKDTADTLDVNSTWFYTTSTGAPKPASTVISNLHSVNASHSLYLLNVGPDRTGRITQPYLDRLAEIGALH